MAIKAKDLYVNLLFNRITGGALNNNSKISSIGVHPGYGRIDTKNKIRKMWIIQNIPNELPYNIVELLKCKLEGIPGVKTIITTHNIPVNIAIHSDQFKNMRDAEGRRYEDYKEVFNSLRKNEQDSGKSYFTSRGKVTINRRKLDTLRLNSMSYDYIFKHQSSGGKFFRTYIIIEAIFNTNPNEIARESQQGNIKSYSKLLETLLKGNQIDYKMITNNTSEFLENFGVCGELSPRFKQRSILTSDDDLAGNSITRTIGLVGGKGVLLGTDWRTRLPIFVDFCGSGNAQIILVYGRTGSGKSIMSFGIALSFLVEGAHCTVIDIKGNEWSKLLKYVPSGKIISMGGTEGRFVNTLRLDDLDVKDEEALQYYNMALKGTVKLMETIIGDTPQDISSGDINAQVTQIVKKTLTNHGVVGDQRYTFEKTKDLKLTALMKTTEELIKSCSSQDDAVELRILQLIKRRCERILGQGAANLFKDEITLAEVLKSPLVIFSFDKNVDTSLDNMDALRVFMVQHLDMKKQFVRKQHKLQSVSFYEELQRTKQMGSLVSYVNHTVTGSRSNNVTIFLLINSLAALDNDMEAVKASITSKIIGITNDDDKKRLEESYGCRHIMDLINKISDPSESSIDAQEYNHCFVLDYNTGQDDTDIGNSADSAIFKSVLNPKMLADLSTRDTQ